MNRRALLTRPISALREARSPGITGSTKTHRKLGGDLTPYSGSWGREQASHLLRRCMFGPTADEIETAITDGLDVTMQKLLTAAPIASPPLNYSNQNDPEVPVGQAWVDANNSVNVNASRSQSLFGWWCGLMINQGVSLTEQMSLFWHNHFALEIFQ